MDSGILSLKLGTVRQMATIRLNRRGSSLGNLEQRGLDLDCAELSSRSMGPDEESSSATTVGSFQGSVTLCRVQEEGRIASRRQTAIDARMASVRGALVLRIEESYAGCRIWMHLTRCSPKQQQLK